MTWDQHSGERYQATAQELAVLDAAVVGVIT
jgi:hypothetical protein